MSSIKKDFSYQGVIVVHYHVQIRVRSQIYENFVSWLKMEHIPEVLESEGFFEAELLLNKMGTALESSSKELKVIYKIKSEDFLRKYLAERAMILREKGMKRFPGEYTAEREIWSHVEPYFFTN